VLRSEHLSSSNTCRAAKTHNKFQTITRDTHTHPSPYANRFVIGTACCTMPPDHPHPVATLSRHAVTCDFPTADISTAQALLFESAGCAADPAGAHKDRDEHALACPRVHALARPPGVCSLAHAPTHRNACGPRTRSLRSCPALRLLPPALPSSPPLPLHGRGDLPPDCPFLTKSQSSGVSF
jgi:hypothetical protein